MKIVNLRQGSAEWLAWRDQGVSASDIAVVLGISPYKTPWRLWAEKAGKVPPEDLSDNMFVAHGKRCEPAVRAWFEAKHDTMLFPACAEADHPIIRASFDGLTDDGIPVELKAPSDSVFDEVVALREDATAFRLYSCQVQAQIFVSGTDHGYLVFGRVIEKEDGSLVVDEAVEFRVDRDEAFIADMLQRAEAFMGAVNAGKEPKKDPSRDTYSPASDEEKQEWEVAAMEYRDAAAKIDALKAEIATLTLKQDNAKERLIKQMGQFAQAEASGILITRYISKGRVDYTALLEHHKVAVSDADLDKFRSASSESVKVSVKKAKPTGTQSVGPVVAAAA
ncbi:endonuclease (plasmid) [Azospirillum sp. TSA2s]|uniref:YqaJ viral recombinase family nuclease n=1 Tax=Azospirillum sp. TSA2s TaxID=709810 RepID=UPI0010AA9E6E|nr:YqaJ viral recombinase family protein [Azospirillum sp. TSA2s]QCG99204.1 endonuclease [Azospirillum sp. TSA2s]